MSARVLILEDWLNPHGHVVGSTVRQGDNGRDGPSHVCRDVAFDDTYLGVVDAWVQASAKSGRSIIDRRTARTEVLALADGEADQRLIGNVPPVVAARRLIATEEARREAARQARPLPAGGLFDQTARAQLDLFA